MWNQRQATSDQYHLSADLIAFRGNTMPSPITTHILDTSRGCPAAGVNVVLAMQTQSGEWQELAEGTTNADGRIADLLPENVHLQKGEYRLTFETGQYFRSLGIQSLYPLVSLIFEVHEPSQHYHVPLLLSPFGYSTYRGS
jgi:5-hydroxyisourate hydrolase